MGAGRKTQTINAHENVPGSTVSGNGCFSARNLRAEDLCGVIFGCSHKTMAECLSKQLFGLPSGHIAYVKNIGERLPLFLFNYNDRTLHGIYEAASHGRMNISSSAWTDGGLQRTPFPAQVRIRTRIQCQALVEDQFKKIIEKNYFTLKHFWFELDHAQTRDLIALFKPSHYAARPSSMLPSVASREKKLFQSFPAMKSGALTKKELPQGATRKDVVSGDFQNVKDRKQSHYFINENKFASLLSDGGDSECDSPIKTSSNGLEDMESKEPVSDWENQAVDNVQSINSDGGAWFGRENNTSNGHDDMESKEPVSDWEDQAVDNAQSINSDGGAWFGRENNASNGHDDMESKEPVSDWEDQAVDNVQSINSDGGAWFGRENSTFEKQQNINDPLECEEKRVLHILENLAADHAQLNASSNGYIDDSVCCAPKDVYENTAYVLDELSVLAKKEDYVAASYLNHGGAQGMKNSYASVCNGSAQGMKTSYASICNGRAQDMENLYASSCNGSAGIVEYSNASDLNHGNIELARFIKEVKAWAVDVKNHQAESDREIQQLKNQLWHSDRKIGLLEDRVKELELKTDQSKLFDESLEKFVKQYLGSEDVIYLIGGFDGSSWLSTLDSFSPSLDIITPLKSMNSARSCAASVALDGNLFVFGGSSGGSWLDTVEYYNRRHDEWISCPSMLRKKGSLSGATMNGKIFAIGGGDGIECLSDVETFDLETGKWFSNKPMLYKRFASATAVFNGAIFAVGGYNVNQYLHSAESFDPREGRWTQLPSMKTRRGSHALAVFNENLYCIGGFDGQRMVSSVEIYEPRVKSWVIGEPMEFTRGYAAAVVLGSSLFAIGGIDDEENILDTVECYKEGIGWSRSDLKAIGRRCFCSAIVL